MSRGVNTWVAILEGETGGKVKPGSPSGTRRFCAGTAEGGWGQAFLVFGSGPAGSPPCLVVLCFQARRRTSSGLLFPFFPLLLEGDPKVFALSGLDSKPGIRYSVHMVERFVQNNAQHSAPQQPESLTSGAAAPMVERAFRLLELLSVSEEGLTLSELARALGMSKSSVHGLLKTLENNHAIEQTSERHYMLGPRIFDLAQAYGQRPGLRRFALPAMRRLAASIGQAVFLGQIEQARIRVLECVEDEVERPALSISARRGARIPLMAGATARVALASWPVAKRAAFLQVTPLPHFTERSITDPTQLLAAAEETARTGVAYDYGEYLTGVNAVAVPILGPGSAVEREVRATNGSESAGTRFWTARGAAESAVERSSQRPQAVQAEGSQAPAAEGALVALLWIAGFASHFGAEAMRSAGQQLRSEAEAISRSLGAR